MEETRRWKPIENARGLVFLPGLVYLLSLGCPPALRAANTPPQADAGVDQSGVVGQTLTLDGHGSWDAEGDSLHYRWWERATNPQLGLLSDSTAVRPSLTPALAGSYQFVLQVRDDSLGSAPDTVQVTVTAAGGGAPRQVVTPAGSTHELVLVPAGWFQMGSNAGWTGERPAHSVYLDTFYVDRYEVTNRQWNVYAAAVGKAAKADSADHPALDVSWPEARDYCAWAGLRLPTEAEWEKAARGPDGRSYPWGEGLDGSKANYLSGDPYEPRTTPVGYYPAGVSPYGAYDLAGNVWEWVADWYDAGYYAVSPSTNPTGPTSGLDRGLRGGACYDLDPHALKTFARHRDSAWADTSYYVGFRCVQGAAVGPNLTPPDADAGPDQRGFAGETFALSGRGSRDPDGYSLDYWWEEGAANPVRGLLADSTTVAPTVRPPHPGSYVYVLRVWDGVAFSARDTVRVEVLAPVVTLEVGWNLVSLPTPIATDSMAAIVRSLDDKVVRVLGFETPETNPNAPNSGGLIFDLAVPPFVRTLLLVDPRLGYWFKMSEAATLSAAGAAARPVAAVAADRAGREFMGLWGELAVAGTPAPVGTLVEVLDGSGVVAGESRVRHPGYYGLVAIYRDGPETPQDEGAQTGEWLTLQVDGRPTQQRVQWTAFGDVARVDITVSSVSQPSRPAAPVLAQNYPNPFNASTRIAYELACAEHVTLTICSLSGQLVRRLVDAPQPAGRYQPVWDGRNAAGQAVANGVYLCVLRAGEFAAVRKMALLK